MPLSKEQIDRIHETSTIKEVPLADLKVDRSYQRDISQALVDEIASNFDIIASELVLVSDRGKGRDHMWPENGRFYIVNGQHRAKAAQKIGRSKIWARIIFLDQEEDPGAIESTFRLKTNVGLSDRPLERFKAQLRAGDPESIAIQEILASFGTEMNATPSKEVGVNSVAGVEMIYRVDDGVLLRETLTLIKDIYRSVGGKYVSANVLKSLAWFIDKHAAESDRGRLVDKLQLAGLASLDRRARTIQSTMGNTLWLNYYRAIVDFYNERLGDRQRLEWNTRGAQRFASGRRDSF